MKLGLVILLSVVTCAVAVAQSSHGYLFGAPGGTGSVRMVQVGGGGEGIIGKGFGVSAEIGALVSGDNGLGVASVNGSFHFLRAKTQRLDPFVTSGYTLLFSDGSASLLNIGVGVNYWFHRHVGAKFELRDHITRSEGLWGVRFGVTLRGGR